MPFRPTMTRDRPPPGLRPVAAGGGGSKPFPGSGRTRRCSGSKPLRRPSMRIEANSGDGTDPSPGAIEAIRGAERTHFFDSGRRPARGATAVDNRHNHQRGRDFGEFLRRLTRPTRAFSGGGNEATFAVEAVLDADRSHPRRADRSHSSAFADRSHSRSRERTHFSPGGARLAGPGGDIDLDRSGVSAYSAPEDDPRARLRDRGAHG